MGTETLLITSIVYFFASDKKIIPNMGTETFKSPKFM